MDRRKRRLGILSYDDLLSQLADALEAEAVAGRGADAPALADRAGRRVPGHRPGAVGGARPGLHRSRHDGADRRPQAGHLRLPRRRRHDLPHRLGHRRRPSRRSRSTGAATPPCCPPCRSCCAGAALGDERIVVRDVEAHHTESRLVGAGHPFRVRVVRRTDVSKRPGLLTVGQVRPRIATDLAHDIRRLLDSGATFEGRPVRPRDIAVISYRHADLADAQAALADVARTRRDRGWRQRVRDAGRDRVADAARGPGAAAPQHPRPGGGPHLLLRAHRRRPRHARRRADRRGGRRAALVAGALRRAAAWPRCSRPRPSAACPRGCWPRSAASGG